MIGLPAATLDRYRRCSLYNSPFPAHDRGHAVDLYPEGGRRSVVAPSPVAGVVRDVLTVRAPSRPYAARDDHLVLVDVDAAASGLRVDRPDRERGTGGADPALVARVLHVDPAVTPGDRVAVGDPLGETVRSGFFAPWVADHVHLDVRPADRNLRRATGSLPLAIDVAVEALPWGGTGRVVETGGTYAVLDAPAHPAPGERWVGVAGAPGVALDGGFPHYGGGGAHAAAGPGAEVSLAGTRVGRVGDDGRTVGWRAATVTANGHPLTGVSLFLARDSFGAKLVSRDGHPFDVGERVTIAVAVDGE
ncbi:MAG: hypothetical protein ABEH47_00410 [Haloferacaceae archaeon]